MYLFTELVSLQFEIHCHLSDGRHAGSFAVSCRCLTNSCARLPLMPRSLGIIDNS
jgi:hypothetical protein